ncbi:hypothetical protein Q31a_11810 [Aureliella helgolandensis]|uniref:Uncharacterized protein n=1 Tax=Aureliella helgolandensis TaxID=2527968 RepID=A0A518G2R8_9BACT|nr:hypothetical protein Q31a_11810 [Aureliella helgolandensis]
MENLFASGWWVKTSPLPRPVDEETGVQLSLQSPPNSFETAMEVSYSVAMRMTRRAHEQQKPVVGRTPNLQQRTNSQSAQVGWLQLIHNGHAPEP